MPWTPHPHATSGNPALDLVTEILDPVLKPLGFAPGQSNAAEGQGQVVFCRGHVDSADEGCVDLVVDLEESLAWRVIGVRYWGLPSDRWNLEFDRDASLAEQVSGLAHSLPVELA